MMMKKILASLFALSILTLGISAYAAGSLNSLSDENRQVVSYNISVNGRDWLDLTRDTCLKTSDNTTGAFRLDWNSSGNVTLRLRYWLFNSNDDRRSDAQMIRQCEGRQLYYNWAVKGHAYHMKYRRENRVDPSCQFIGSWATDES